MSKVLLVLASLLIFFLTLEGGSRLYVKFYGPKYGNHWPRTRDEIWTREDVERLSYVEGRAGEIARIIKNKNYLDQVKFRKYTPAEMALLKERAMDAPSEKGNTLHLQNFKLTPNLDEKFTVYGSSSKKVKYTAHYTTDSTGMRKAYPGSKKNIIFLGCSFTFGQGLENEETFPWLVGKKTGFRTFNKGIPGSSPLNVLQHLREMKTDFFKNIPPDETTVVLTLIPEHFQRIFHTNAFIHLTDHKTDYPYVIEDGDDVIIKTRYKDDPYGIHQLQFYLSRLEFPLALGFDFPFTGANEYRLFSKIIFLIEKEMRMHFPHIRHFVVALYPTGSARKIYKILSLSLEEKKHFVLDYTPLQGNALLGNAFHLKYDFHPSPFMSEMYSELLVHDLRKAFGF